MRRMGWEGAGLGATEQGIQEPIRGGDVRENSEKYKVYTWINWITGMGICPQGMGMDMQDPFDMFRKNRSYTYNRKPRSPGTCVCN